MNRQDLWELTIHDWLHCMEAGVKPVVMCSFLDEGPQYYRPTSILFDNPPLRESFLRVVAMTPWMQVWEKDLLPVIAANPWPMIDYAHKAADVILRDTQGQEVGRLELKRREMFLNGRYHAPFITFDLMKASARLPKAKWNDAWNYVEKRRYEIMERLLTQGPRGSIVVGWTNAELALEIRKVLVEGGFLKRI
jgi:hypothetical protein